ncbi:MAG: hypothetical protein HYY04_00440 [Chloroflexi bacterium]|nr:hypothetical protein [Chloroflexota bacterium]
MRLREASQAPENGAAPAESIPLRPLKVSGIVVRKADLVEALRIYVPGLSDLRVDEDGEQFFLLLSEEAHREDPAAQ